MDNNEKQHKRLFKIYLKNIKGNDKIIPRANLSKIKDYLETGSSSQLDLHLKRRITTNHFLLLSSGGNSGTKSLCVGSKYGKV